VNYLTFSLDDGYASWVEASKLLEEYGWKGTFYTCLRNVVHVRKDTRKRLFPPSDVITWSELKDIQIRGHEIANHGTRHIDLPLCNKMEKWMEVVASKKVFTSMGINVTTYGCAFNSYGKESLELGLQHYPTFRNWLGVNTIPIKTPIYKVLRAGEAYEEASTEDNKWVLSTWHDVDLGKFRKYLEKVKKLNIEVKTVRWMYANSR
jgi:peptidoglycan/xylan/chitin deacetylase (PgdA/CDA1 family)